MRLTPQEEAYTREVAAQIGRDPEDLIREGEQLKEQGYREAQTAAEHAASWTERSHDAAGGRSLYGSPESPAYKDRHGRDCEREAGG